MFNMVKLNDFIETMKSTIKESKNYKIEEMENEYLIKLEVPGYKKEDLKISIQKNTLTISGKSEKICDNFESTFEMSDYLDKNNISSNLEDGILYVKIPKKESLKPRDIQIS